MSIPVCAKDKREEERESAHTNFLLLVDTLRTWAQSLESFHAIPNEFTVFWYISKNFHILNFFQLLKFTKMKSK